MLNDLITSSARIKLLLKFFVNPLTTGYLRQLASEFGESTNGIRVELNKLTDANILNAQKVGRNKVYQANVHHPIYNEIREIVLKSTGLDRVAEDIIKKLGNVNKAFIRGDYAVGIDSGIIDLVVVGDKINTKEMERVRIKTEKLISRKISILLLGTLDFKNLESKLKSEPNLILL